MSNIQKLSDNQLINLFKSNLIDKDLKNAIIKEIDRRELSKMKVIDKDLSNNEKIKIIFTSCFSFKYHLNKSNELLISGNKKGYKQYWFYFTIGIFLSLLLLLLITKYVIKPLYF